MIPLSLLLWTNCHCSSSIHTLPKMLLSLSLPFTFLISLFFFSYSATAAYSTTTCSNIVPLRYRSDRISITDFGGIGDGRTLNTKAFRAAVYRIQHLRRRGGTVLYVPPGVYLTESLNLTSHMTLYLAAGAVIKATQVLLTLIHRLSLFLFYSFFFFKILFGAFFLSYFCWINMRFVVWKIGFGFLFAWDECTVKFWWLTY